MIKSRIYLVLFSVLFSLSCNKDATIIDNNPVTPGDGTTMTVSSPNGGEALKANVATIIKWTSNTTNKINIEISFNLGKTWSLIDKDISNSGLYSWTPVDSLISNTCLIRVLDATNSKTADISDNIFSIVPNIIKTLTLTSPNGGETLIAGKSHRVRWTSSNIANVKLQYSTNSGTSWTSIIATTPADSQGYTWTPIPEAVSSLCKFRISDAAADTIYKVSASDFSIFSTQSVSILKPTAQEILYVGSSYEIRWAATDIPYVKIELSTNNGTGWTTVTESTPNDSSYTIASIPNTPSDLCKLKISDASDKSPSVITEYVFSIQTRPIITLSAPNGGESIAAGTNYSITWNSASANGAVKSNSYGKKSVKAPSEIKTSTEVKIELSTNGGSSWSTIINATPNDGSYTWAVDKSLSSTTCRVKVSDASTGTPSDASENDFTVYIVPPKTISLTSPNGGESYEAATVHPISWTASGFNYVKIELSADGGNIFTTVASSVAATAKTYSWTVPSSVSGLCRIKISDATDNTVSDTSNANFSITAAQAIVVTKPNGAESLTAGGTYNITWASTNVSNVKIEYTTNNGVDWATIVSSTPSTGFYTWNSIPNILSTNCKIRISDALDNSPMDLSDATFSILAQPAIRVTSPNGGEKVLSGSNYSITWVTSGAIANKSKRKVSIDNELQSSTGITDVKIELTTDGGTNWSTITSSTANNGSYIWNPVPSINSALCRVRISNSTDGTPSDISDSVFTIYNQVFQSVSVLSPNGGETYISGGSTNITWNSAGIAAVSIDYTINNGVTWTSIVKNIASNGIYNWSPIPNISSTNCKVRVYDATDTIPSDESNNTFIILPQPTITVTTPNGGETYSSGSTHNITWNSQAISTVKIELTINNGASWTKIADSVISSGSYAWAVPNVSSSLCKIKISNSSDGSPSDFSDNVFGISNQSAQTVKVLTPNGGETWTAGTTQSIIWNTGGIDSVKIEMTTNNGVTWSSVVNKVASNGIYEWLVPNTVSANCKVRISDYADGSPVDASDTSFTITAQPVIHLTSPNGGERVSAGNSYTILWTSSGQSIANCKIELSIDGGVTYPTVITQSTPNSGSYTWNPVPTVSSSTCKVRVSDASISSTSDASDSNFVISIIPAQTVAVTAPNGGESLVAGGNVAITWTSSGVTNVGLDYTTNNGVSWTNIVTNIPSNGYYLWNPIPNVVSTNCKVRVYDALDTLPVAQSTNSFTILSAPAITVISPNGGESLTTGIVHNITWTSQGIASVKLEYTINNGATWTNIADSVISSGSYAWTVPNVSSSLCKVRVSNSAGSNPADISDNVFTISNQLPQSVKVIKPNGGETWTAGTTQSIIWNTGGIDSVKIEMTTNNGVTWSSVVNKVASNGIYEWLVPNTVSANCKVRISDYADGSPVDASDTSFTITAQPVIHLTSPNGGERVSAGSSYTILWTSSGQSIANCKIELSIDGGANYSTLITSITPNSGNYTWSPVPTVSSSTCKIRVSDAASATTSDVSDSNFVINVVAPQTVAVTAPNGGESLVAGGNVAITWTSSGVTNVGLDYTTNNGVSWTNIVANIPSNGYYLWNPIPNVLSTNCKVRVYDALDTLPVAQSTNSFTILSAPSLIVVAPNGGEQLIAGSTKNIIWTSSNVVTVRIQLSTNNGASWSTIADSLPSSGLYAWTVPVLSSSLCKIKISEHSTGIPKDESDNTFVLLTSVPQTISVTAPVGGESLSPGTSFAIKWVSSAIDSVHIEVSTNNGVSWSEVVAKTPSNGVYIWSPVPALNSTNCIVRVSDAKDGDPSAISTQVFSVISQPVLKVTSPNGGEKILSGTSRNITWTTAYTTPNRPSTGISLNKNITNSIYDISNVKLELSTDEGINWIVVSNSTPNTGTYQWNPVPNVNSSLCRIRVSDVVIPSLSDISDSNFVIYNQAVQSIIVNTPKGGEALSSGSSYDITWTSSAVSAVNIELSTNNGVNWSTITNNIASNGYYHWSPIPNVSSTNCKVRISDALDSIPFAFSASTFSILPAPTLKVISPLGGESYTGGQLVNVLWNSTNLSAVRIELTTNNGASWTTVLDSAESNGIYLWTVPSINSMLCKIRISERSAGNPSAVSDNAFTISTQTVQTVKVNYPKGGEIFPSGSSQTITWNSAGIDSVKIEYTTDNGVNWTTLVSKTHSNGFYQWNPIPSLYSTNCKIRVSDATDGNPYAVSDNVFTISPNPTIVVVKPNGGEVWATGSTQTIQWSSSLLQKVKIQLTTDGGASWQVVSDSTVSNGSFGWTVPSINSSLCKIKIQDITNGLTSDESDLMFTVSNQISQNLSMTSPNGGEIWEATSSHHITWTSSAINKAKIEYTTNNGISWTTITDSVESNGLYSWNPIPNVSSTLCKVRISDASDGTPSVSSATTFTINPKKSILVSYPNGNENLTSGTNYNITWTSSGVQYVNIEYRIGNSSGWVVITQNAPDNGTYSWSPSIAASGYKVRVSDASLNASTADESDGTFTVLPEPSITVLTPIEGISLQSGSLYDIRWNSINITAVKIELSTNNGASWSSITDSTVSTGIYQWTVPNIYSALCKIRVSNQAGGLPAVSSQGTFIIYNTQPQSIRVTAPNSGEKYPIGTAQNITWNSQGINNVKIEYSSDNGINWNVITASTPSSGFYQWNPVPASLSSNCKLRISEAVTGNPYDLSDSTFSIIPQGTIKVLKPSGGEVFISGTTENIQWSSQNITNVTIEYSQDNGASWNTIAANIPSTGLYSWSNIPVVNSDQCRLKIKNAVNGIPYDTSATNFSIVQSKQMRIVFPNSKTDVISQDTTFMWYSVGVTKVNLSLSVDNGLTWSALASNINSTGAYAFALPVGVTSSLARFKVTDAADATVYDISDQPFVIGFTPPGKVETIENTGNNKSTIKWSGAVGYRSALQYSFNGIDWIDIEEVLFTKDTSAKFTSFENVSRNLKFRVNTKSKGLLSEVKLFE